MKKNQNLKRQKIVTWLSSVAICLMLVAAGTVGWRNQDKIKGAMVTKVQPSRSVTILTTGDAMFGRSVNFKGWQKNDFGWSLQNIKETLAAADITVVQVETPIIENCPLTNEGMIFCAAPGAGAALKDAGVDVATLANNHIYNHGRDGLAETEKILTDNQIDYAIEKVLVQKKFNGQKFGFLAFDDLSTNLSHAEMQTITAAAAAEVDTLLVSLHFGREYNYQPAVAQEELAHSLIDQGAKIIVGNHSHWIGKVEEYNDGVIIYSHGNLVFDQMWSDETREGVVAEWQFTDGDLTRVTLQPIWITEYGLANLATGERANKILTTVQKISGDIGTIANKKLVIDFID